MTGAIPYRIYYSKSETAQLTGQSVTTINRRIREGLRPYPGPDAILPDYTRQFGDQIKIHRAYVTGEPANVTQSCQSPLTDEQLDAALDRAIARCLRRIAPAL